MTSTLVEQLVSDGYQVVIRIDVNEIGAAKTLDLTDDTDIDIFEVDANEDISDLELGREYHLSDLL